MRTMAEFISSAKVTLYAARADRNPNMEDSDKMEAYQPKTGEPCNCGRGIQRDNCPECEGTGMRIDFRAIRERAKPRGVLSDEQLKRQFGIPKFPEAQGEGKP